MRLSNVAWVVALLAFLFAGCSHARHTHMTVESTPPAVADGFHREFPGLAISHIDSLAMPDGSTEYELKFRDAQNKYHHKLFTADGKLLDDKLNVALPAGGAAPMPPGKGI